MDDAPEVNDELDEELAPVVRRRHYVADGADAGFFPSKLKDIMKELHGEEKTVTYSITECTFEGGRIQWDAHAHVLGAKDDAGIQPREMCHVAPIRRDNPKEAISDAALQAIANKCHLHEDELKNGNFRYYPKSERFSTQASFRGVCYEKNGALAEQVKLTNGLVRANNELKRELKRAHAQIAAMEEVNRELFAALPDPPTSDDDDDDDGGHGDSDGDDSDDSGHDGGDHQQMSYTEEDEELHHEGYYGGGPYVDADDEEEPEEREMKPPAPPSPKRRRLDLTDHGGVVYITDDELGDF